MRAETTWLATMDSGSYQWTAIGRTEEEARQAIEKAWATHTANLRGRWADYAARFPEEELDLESEYGLYVREVEIGAGYMDDWKVEAR